jgi:CDP-diacylglycerol--glycerol-3-phosphate 3-phosphatidyltransferase
LDPVADKLLVVVVLVLLIQKYPGFWITLAGIIIVGREIIVTALREWMAELGKRASIKVSMLGKLKTTAQMTALIILLLFDPARHWTFHILGIWCLYLAAVLTLWSMFQYLNAARKAMRH